MDLKHLEQIVAISRHGGFSGAARRLGMAQSTLSKNIARLEAKLGVELFARDGGAAQPTSYGRFLVARAEAVLREVEALNHDFDKLVHGERGRLRIGVGPAPRHGLLGPIVTAMAQRYPQLSLRTAQDNAQRLVSDLAEGAYDAVFVHQEAAAPFGDLVRVRVLQGPHVALARPGHPLLGQGPLTPEQLLEFRLASCPPSGAFLDWIGPVSGAAAEHLAGFRTDSYDLIRERLLSGDFVTVAPAFVYQDDVERGVLASAPLAWEGLYECWMLVARERWRSPEIKAMAEAAKAAGAWLEAALAP